MQELKVTNYLLKIYFYLKLICFNRVGSIPISMFDIASETTQLIYGQTITWLGLFFSPLLPLIFVIVLIITFYVKNVSCQNFYISLISITKEFNITRNSIGPQKSAIGYLSKSCAELFFNKIVCK